MENKIMENKTYTKKIKQLETENKKLRDTLGFYSMDCNYRHSDGWPSKIQLDRGFFAMKVLRKKF